MHGDLLCTAEKCKGRKGHLMKSTINTLMRYVYYLTSFSLLLSTEVFARGRSCGAEGCGLLISIPVTIVGIILFVVLFKYFSKVIPHLTILGVTVFLGMSATGQAAQLIAFIFLVVLLAAIMKVTKND